jgi:uncharacterized protein (TIGR00156 family)
MKKSLATLAFCLSFLLAATAMAQFTGPSANPQPSTVAQAGDARVGSNVTLEGNVVGHLRDEYYTFRDASGEIRVEIDRRTWNGREVGPADKVRISGEIERDWRGRYIDVERLDVL